MTDHETHPNTHPGWMLPMRARSPKEAHRASTALELFFDLVFVIAVAQAAGKLHHGIAEGHAAEAILSFVMMFFAIWWAWMNFTWFASAYDTDDVPYRLTVFIQLIGSLILAVGVGRVFDHRDLTIATLGYVVMRVGLVAQWIRAARSDTGHRATDTRYAIGVGVVQLGWIILLFLPESVRMVGFFVLVVAELAVPIWAEQPGSTPWHPGHIGERYGLFTIIVLGESLLAASVAIQEAIEAGSLDGNLVSIIVGGLLIVLTMWWLYFDYPTHGMLTSLRRAFTWGYGHFFVFASAAAVGAGLAVSVDYATHHAEIDSWVAGAAVAVPVAIYLVVMWLLHQGPGAVTDRTAKSPLGLIVAVLILLTPLTGQPVLITGLLLAALLTIKLIRRQRQI